MHAHAVYSQVCVHTVCPAGPFAKYGSKVVEAAVEQGSHYCDITGVCGYVCVCQERFCLSGNICRVAHSRPPVKGNDSQIQLQLQYLARQSRATHKGAREYILNVGSQALLVTRSFHVCGGVRVTGTEWGLLR
jgi:hypothetical protein